jgi:Fe-S-cluster containining protein
MNCREACGACCIIPSISSPIPGMPNGKLAGEKCIHLTDDFKCRLFYSPDRPRVCIGFKPETLICGKSRDEALEIFAELEGMSINK